MKIAEKQDEELKKQWGIFSYVVAAVGTLTEAERFEAVITCEGRSEKVRAYQVAVGNGIHYGGGLTVSPEARIDDGLLDVYAIETASVAELIALAPRLRDGTLVERDDVAFFRGATARIETLLPMPVNTDGEVTTETPAEFSRGARGDRDLRATRRGIDATAASSRRGRLPREQGKKTGVSSPWLVSTTDGMVKPDPPIGAVGPALRKRPGGHTTVIGLNAP